MCYHVMCLGCVFKTFDVIIVRGEVIRKNFINKFKLMSVLWVVSLNFQLEIMLSYLFEIKSILTDGFVKFIWILHVLYKKNFLLILMFG